MLIVYFSLTGNVRTFVENLDMDNYEIVDDLSINRINKDYVLVVPSYENEEITKIVEHFVEYEDNIDYLKGIAGSGNINFDEDYLCTAKRLCDKYNVKLIFDFEFMGTDKEIELFKKEVIRLEKAKGNEKD